MKSETLRVAVFATMLTPLGAPTAALRLARGLADRDKDVTVVFLYARADVSEPEYPFKVLLATSSPRLVDYLRLPVLVYLELRTLNPDAVISFLPLANFLAQTAAALLGIPRRIVSHRAPVSTYSPIMRTLDRFAAFGGVYTDLAAVSRAVLESCYGYPGWLKRRGRVVYNGLSNWAPSPLTRDLAREKFGVLQNTFLLVSVGRLEYQKNLDFLFPILAQLQCCTLLIAGDGSMLSSMRGRVRELGIEDRIRFLGSLDRSGIRSLLRAADLFVQPSRYEGQSNALLEALCSGLPAVVSDVPEQLETIRDESGELAGAALSFEKPGDWVTCISSFRADSELAARKSEIALRRCEIFSHTKMISGFIDLLDGDPRNRTNTAD